MTPEHDPAEIERVARGQLMTEDGLRDKLRDWCLRSGQATVAHKCRVSQPYISMMVAGKAPIGTAVCLAMGYRKETLFFRGEQGDTRARGDG